MKIAIYHNLHSGGAKRALYEITKRLTCSHYIDVYTLATADHEFCDIRPYCDQHFVFPFQPLPLAHRPFGRLNQGIRTIDLLRLHALQQTIAGQIDAGKYDVVFVHHCQYGQSPSVLHYLQTPSVYFCQEPPRLMYEPQIPRPATEPTRMQNPGIKVDPLPVLYRYSLITLDRINATAASLVLVNSDYSRETLYRTYGLFAHVCYLGVDTDMFRPLFLPKENLVISVGGLNPRKGFDFLIRSLSLVPLELRPMLVVVSNYTEPQERSYLELLAKHLSVKVQFLSRIPDDELVSWYNRAIVTLYAPIMEPFGFVPLESMACGTPVIGVREAGVRETICHNETGWLTSRQTSVYAAAMVGLMNNYTHLSQLGLQARQRAVADWDWQQTVSKLESYFGNSTRSGCRPQFREG